MSPRLESMFEPLTRSASVKSVYGEAISANGKTIIPVARVAYGFGGGRGSKPGARSLLHCLSELPRSFLTCMQHSRYFLFLVNL